MCHLTVLLARFRLFIVGIDFRQQLVMKPFALVVSLSIVLLTVLVTLIIGAEKTGWDGAGWHGEGETKA
jgi:hypothetical protein